MFRSLNIDTDKEDRIVNAASKEFANNGYKNASTNTIVKEANISKGLLFHYFSSKKDLYLSLYENLSDMFIEKIYDQLDWDEKDIFRILRQVTVLKFDLFLKYPDLVNFLNSVYKEESKDVAGDINNKKEELIASSFNKLFANIDLSCFKEDLDTSKAIEIIYWTFEGFGKRQQAKYPLVKDIDTKTVLTEMDSYIEMLKSSFYR